MCVTTTTTTPPCSSFPVDKKADRVRHSPRGTCSALAAVFPDSWRSRFINLTEVCPGGAQKTNTGPDINTFVRVSVYLTEEKCYVKWKMRPSELPVKDWLERNDQGSCLVQCLISSISTADSIKYIQTNLIYCVVEYQTQTKWKGMQK